MKKHTLTLVALLSLLLSGCQNHPSRGSQDSAPSSVTEKESEQKPTEKPSHTAKPSEGNSSSAGSSSSSTDSSSQTSGSGSSSSSEETTKWGETVAEKRKRYLGGKLLPYVDLGSGVEAIFVEKKTSYFDSDDEHLEIYGSKALSDPLINEFTAAFTKDGYTIDSSDKENVTAKDEANHLKIVLTKDTDLDVASRKAYYDEPYDKSKFTSYPSDVFSLRQQYLQGHANDLPLVYLGTINPIAEVKDGYRTISGRKWNQSVLDDAKTSLQAAGFDVSKSNYSQTQGSKEFPDGAKLTILVKDGGISSSIPVRTILLGEKFDPSSASSWPKEVTDAFTTYLDGNSLPYLYLGSKNPTVSYDSEKSELVIKGSAYDDQVFSLAKTALVSDGYSVTYDDKATAKVLSATKTFSNKDIISLTLKADSKFISGLGQVSYPRLTASILKDFDPDSFTDYPSDIKAAISSLRDSHEVPVIYLGTATPTRDQYDSSNTVILTGEQWTDRIGTLAEEAFTKAEWEKDSSSTSTSLVFTKTFEDKCTIKATVEKGYSSGKAKLTFKLTPGWNPEGSKDYTDEVKEERKKYLDGNILPYLYLGTKAPTATWNSNSEKLEIKGKLWDDSILDRAKTSFASYTLVKETKGKALTFVTERESGCILSVEISKDGYYDYYPVRRASILKPGSDKDWDGTTKAAILSRTENHSIPYFYRGTTQEASSGNSKYIQGSVAADEKLNYLFDKVFKADQWDVSTNTSGNHYAKKKYEDNYTLIVTLSSAYVSSPSYKAISKISFKVIPPYDKDSLKSYPDDVKEDIQKVFPEDVTLPLIYLGTDKPTSSTSLNSVTITGLGYDEKRVSDNKTTLESAGFTCFDASAYLASGSTSSKVIPALQGYKAIDGKDSTKGYIRFVLKRSSSDQSTANGQVVFYYDKAVSIPSSDADWAEDFDNSSLIMDNLGESLPYFYAGSDVKVTKATSGKGISVKGSFTSKDRNFTYRRNAANTLRKEKKAVIDKLDLGSTNSPKRTRKSTASDGNKIVYTLSGTSSSFAMTAEYVEEFDPSLASAWSEEITKARKDNLGGNVIPFVYLGSTRPTYAVKDGEVIVTGSLFDKQIFALARAALNGYTIVSDDSTFLAASKDAGNGKKLIVTIKTDSNGAPVLTASYK